ncbi:MAG: NAD-dependent protein deacylase [Bacilli bacterium]|jgi:NAD-dependent deacetylase|nr:NAD-dependent protein deacylase [Bacilli bacterium]MCH4201499.1 NAD-dependent protein deacylase [Bacilli bacterium]
MDLITSLSDLINRAHHIVFFGGAGVSTESGIPDFRSQNGLYSLKSKYGVPYEVMLSHSYFESNTATFFAFYRDLMINENAVPNSAHLFLAHLAEKKDVTIITQNIDGLHQMAGSRKVIELHGSIQRNHCVKCGKSFPLSAIIASHGIPFCDQCGGVIKPDVVLYEEPLSDVIITRALIALQAADLLIIAGTSLNVYPASSLINYFFGNNIVVINKDDIPINKPIKLKINGKIGEVFSRVESLIKP